jgi:hypothetical protein
MKHTTTVCLLSVLSIFACYSPLHADDNQQLSKDSATVANKEAPKENALFKAAATGTAEEVKKLQSVLTKHGY